MSTVLKALMKKAGLSVSAGDTMSSVDMATARDYAYHKGLSHEQFNYGLAHNPDQVHAVFGPLDPETLAARQKAEQERIEQEAEAQRLEQERLEQEAEAQRLEQERLAQEAEAQRLAEEQERLEQERLANEQPDADKTPADLEQPEADKE